MKKKKEKEAKPKEKPTHRMMSMEVGKENQYGRNTKSSVRHR